MTSKPVETARTIVAGVRAQFPDLAFADPAGGAPLVLDGLCRKVSKLKIRLKEARECLHLSALEIKAVRENGTAFDPRTATVTPSSYYSDTKDRLDSKLLLQTSPRANYAFHTNREDNPAVVIDFGERVALTKLVIWNRKDSNYARARNIEVDVDGDTGEWANVYSAVARRALIGEQLIEVAQRLSSFGGDPLLVACVQTAGMVLAGEKGRAEDALKASALKPDDAKLLREFLNTEILFPLGLEWNIHGIRRTFRFWSAREVAEYMAFCNEVIAALEALSPNVCYGFGSVLGLIREGKLIGHDDDLDIIISFKREDCPTLSEGVRRVVSHLQQRKFTIRESRFFVHRQILASSGKSVDVFVGLEEDGKVAWYPQRRGTSAVSDVFPYQVASLDGNRCQIPAKPEAYLAAVYGPEWRTPDNGWKHSWKIDPYRDIL
jgi:hypothetical protein